MKLTNRTGRIALVVFAAALAALLQVDLASSQQAPSVEEFVGPFPSWNQVQCGGNDDTATLQTALNNVGLQGQSPVLYIAPGTCRISATLKLGTNTGTSVQNITILGADPATTKIVWAGPAGGSMFAVDGVGHSRYGRLTWDGGGSAKAVYVLSATPNGGKYFSTANRHEDEVFTNLAPDGVAVRAGDSGIGDAETEWMRCHFIGPMTAGILLKNFNVGDYWVWDSEFQNVSYGVTNFIANGENGAGWFSVNRSNFLNNQVADMAINNTGFFSSRWNYSRGSGQHVLSYPIGNPAAQWTAQGETVIDPVHTSYSFGSVGPLGLLDSTIRDTKGDGRVSVQEGYSAQPGGDMWGAGNTFSSGSTPPYLTGGSTGRVKVTGDDKTDAAIDDPGPPALPPAPPASTAPVIEVQNGDIATALAQAGTSHAIVHIPYGTYQVAQTLEVGPNVILTGDGYGATDLHSAGADPILHLAGPSHAVLRDFSMYGLSNNQNQTRASGIVIDNADQSGGVIHAEDWIGARDDVGIQVTNVMQTAIDLLDSEASSNSHTDGGGANPSVDYKLTNSRAHIFNGAGSASDEMYELHGAELVVQSMYYESSIPTTYIAPGSSGTLVLDAGRLSGNPGTLDTSSFDGSLTLIGIGDIGSAGNPVTGPRTFGPNTLLLGYVFGWLPQDAAMPTFAGTPYAMWLPRQNQSGGTVIVQEQAAGVDDWGGWLRNHLEPLSQAVPVQLTDRPADVTNVQMYRVGGQLLHNSLQIAGGGS